MAASVWPTAAVCGTLATLALMEASTICSFIADWLVYLIVTKHLLQRDDVLEPRLKKDLQVIICGLPRTGTTSMMHAMEILGLPCFHGFHIFKPTTCSLFDRAMKYGKTSDWKVLLDGYGSIADFPGACAYQKLMEVYPDAKVILTIRDPNKWYESFSQTLITFFNKYNQWRYRIMQSCMRKCLERHFYNTIFRGKPNDKESSIECYNKHIQDVKDFVDPQKLLVYEVGKDDDAWTILCGFLNVPHPNVPFPSSNNRKTFQLFIKKTFMIRNFIVISYFTLSALIIISLILT